MNDYILFMHDDAPGGSRPGAEWAAYFARLRASGAFQGGSSIGDGVCLNKRGAPVHEVARHLGGYIRVQAADLDAAQALVAGNPVYEAGGTVEVRELPRDG